MFGYCGKGKLCWAGRLSERSGLLSHTGSVELGLGGLQEVLTSSEAERLFK